MPCSSASSSLVLPGDFSCSDGQVCTDDVFASEVDSLEVVVEKLICE